jgi:hypothetical protein
MDNKEQCRAEFEAWKGYPLPPFNSDGQFELDWLHREFVAFVAGLNRRAPAPQAAQPGLTNATVDGGDASHNHVYVRMDDKPSKELWTVGARCHLSEAATSPAPAVVQMTDEQIIDIWAKERRSAVHAGGMIADPVKFARAILAAAEMKHG